MIRTPRPLAWFGLRSNITVISRFLSENEKLSLFRVADNGYELCATRNDPARIARRYEALFDELLR